MSATERWSPFGKRSDCASGDAVLPDHRLAVPGQIRARLALTGSGVDVSGEAAGRRGPAQQAPLLGAAHRDRATGEVGQHGRPGQGGLGARRDRHPHVLAHLDVQHETGHVLGREKQIGPERDGLPADRDQCPHIVAGRDLTPLVELPVRRQVRLRGHSQHPPAVHDDGAVVDPVPVAQRGTDDQDRRQISRTGHDVGQGRLDRVQQRVLQQDVLDRVAGQGQLGEHHQRHALVLAVAGHPQHRLGVARRIGNGGPQRARRDPEKAMAVGRAEVCRVHEPSGSGSDRLCWDERRPAPWMRVPARPV